MTVNSILTSVNVRGIRDSMKRANIFKWCKQKGSDIVFLQETFSSIDIEDNWTIDWGGPAFFSHGTCHSKGVAVLFRVDLDIKIEQRLISKEGRFIFIKGKINGVNIILGNIYSPTRDKEKMQCDFFSEIDKTMTELYDENYSWVIGGDFNIIMNMGLDYMGSRSFMRTRSRDMLSDILDKFNLVDIWRKKNPNKKEFTFRQKTPVVQTRLDYLFISSNLENEVKKCEILVSITPDHSGIKLQLGNIINSNSFGRSYWKFNSSLCTDNNFVDSVIRKINELKETWHNQITDKIVFWDFIKMKLREFIVKYSSEKAKDRRTNIEKLENEIKDLDKRLVNTPTKLISDEIDRKKIDLEKLYDFGRQGVKVRSRAPWSEEGERNIQYFEQLLKTNKKKSMISEIYDKDGNKVTDKNEVLRVIKTFYEKLYSQRDNVIGNDSRELFFKDMKSLCEDSKRNCEGKVTNAECYKALKELKWNKSPGNDGFTAEFYCTFWPVLGDLLVNALNETFERGLLSNSQRQGVITLIEKDGKDNLQVKNYRPITLLNVDYKILSKVLAKRVKEILGEIIHFDQIGYIKNRNIGEAVRLIDDMFFFSINQSIGFLGAVDFEKAFDSVSHEFILKVLKKFGFGDDFCTWIKILYRDISSCVMNGGHSTGYFSIGRGVRQGDPLSPYIFVMAIEILTMCIRNDKNVRGIKLGETEIKQVLYADDITLFLKDTDSVKRVKMIFDDFEKISGLKVNNDKTNFMWLGKDNELPGPIGFGNTVHEVKILGVYFTRDVKRKEELNYKEILSKIKRLLGWWKQRDLSMMGKVQLLKTYVLSKFNYVSSLITVPKLILEEVERASFDFIWCGKDRIKRKILYQDYEYGGLRMTNYETFVKSQRIMWLKRLLYGDDFAGWKISFDFCCRSVGGRFVFLCDYDLDKMNLKDVPPFYKEILKIWQEMDNCRHYEENKINPIIFNNKNIFIRSKSFFDKDLVEKGILQMEDIMDGNEMKPPPHFWAMGIKGKELLQIYDICNAIKVEWKRNEFMQIDINLYNLKVKIDGHVGLFSDVKSRKMYDYFIKQLQRDYTLQVRDGHGQFNHTRDELKNIFLRFRSAVLCCKHREFQYKLLHGALYTNEHLFRFGFTANNLCTFCHKEVETYPHVFLFCELVKQIWQDIIRKFDLREINFNNWPLIFMGIQGNSPRTKMCNTIIIVIKHIIYLSRSKGTLPSTQNVLTMISNYEMREKDLANKKGKIGLHLQKWDQLKDQN